MGIELRQIEDLVQPILTEREIELVELNCHSHGGSTTVRLLVDKVGGVTVATCGAVNRLVSQALEDAHVFEGPYTVEVSSPGLDRPLSTHRDYERALGEEVVLQFLDGDRVKELQGTLLAVQPDAVVIKTAEGNMTVTIAQIRNAKKAIRW
jgi:ribosome maturation factor RimP